VKLLQMLMRAPHIMLPMWCHGNVTEACISVLAVQSYFVSPWPVSPPMWHT
jgi:hypothetical protein